MIAPNDRTPAPGETPPEHLRNALQLLELLRSRIQHAGAVLIVAPGNDDDESKPYIRPEPFSSELLQELEGMDRRIRAALEELEGPRVITGDSLRRYMAELAAEELAAERRPLHIDQTLHVLRERKETPEELERRRRVALEILNGDTSEPRRRRPGCLSLTPVFAAVAALLWRIIRADAQSWL